MQEQITNKALFLVEKGRTFCNAAAYDKAIVYFGMALQINPNLVEALVGKGDAFRLKGQQYGAAAQRFDKAIDIHPNDAAIMWFDKVLEIDPTHVFSLGRKGDILRRQGKYALAIWYLNRAREVDAEDVFSLSCLEETLQLKEQPDRVLSCCKEGEAFYTAGDYDNAMRCFEAALILELDSVEALAWKGNVLRMKERYEEAIDFFNRALFKNPAHVFSLARKGETLRQKNQYDAAIAWFDQALAIDSQHVFALACKGETLRQQNQYKDAIAWFDQALAIDSKHVFSLACKGETLRQQNQYKDAITWFDRALVIDSKHVFSLSCKGEALRQAEQYDDAMSCFDALLEVEPNNTWALDKKYLALKDKGYLFGCKQENDAALVCFEAALKIKPNDVVVLSYKGGVLLQKGELDAAIIVFDQVLRIDSKQANALSWKGEALRRLTQYNAAIIWFDQTLVIDPKNVYSLASKGDCLRQQGHYDAAMTLFDRALSIAPKNVFSLGFKGEAFNQQQAYADAIDCFDMLLDIEPKNARALSQRAIAVKKLHGDTPFAEWARGYYKDTTFWLWQTEERKARDALVGAAKNGIQTTLEQLCALLDHLFQLKYLRAKSLAQQNTFGETILVSDFNSPEEMLLQNILHTWAQLPYKTVAEQTALIRHLIGQYQKCWGESAWFTIEGEAATRILMLLLNMVGHLSTQAMYKDFLGVLDEIECLQAKEPPNSGKAYARGNSPRREQALGYCPDLSLETLRATIVLRMQNTTSTPSPTTMVSISSASQKYFQGRPYETIRISGDGDCGYSAYDTTRVEAYKQLKRHEGDAEVQRLLAPVIKETLYTEDFIRYLGEAPEFQACIAAFRRYTEASNRGGEMDKRIEAALESHATNDDIVAAFIDYDVQGHLPAVEVVKHRERGWAHPCILQALAFIDAVDLYLCEWEDGEAIPHKKYPVYRHSAPKAEKYLLFVNRNHFEKMDFSNVAAPAVESVNQLSIVAAATPTRQRAPSRVQAEERHHDLRRIREQIRIKSHWLIARGHYHLKADELNQLREFKLLMQSAITGLIHAMKAISSGEVDAKPSLFAQVIDAACVQGLKLIPTFGVVISSAHAALKPASLLSAYIKETHYAEVSRHFPSSDHVDIFSDEFAALITSYHHAEILQASTNRTYMERIWDYIMSGGVLEKLTACVDAIVEKQVTGTDDKAPVKNSHYKVHWNDLIKYILARFLTSVADLSLDDIDNYGLAAKLSAPFTPICYTPLCFEPDNKTPSTLSLPNAYSLARLSDLAYETERKIDELARLWGYTKLSKDSAPKAYHAKTYQFFISDNDLQVFILADEEKICVAFRGTNTVMNGITDAHIHLTEGVPHLAKIKVHAGFKNALEDSWADIRTFIRSHYIEARMRGKTPGVWFTGHSLGGALATLAAFRYFTEGMIGADDMHVYTFGQPMCGNQAFAEYMNRHIKDYQRFENYLDPVPAVPDVSGYTHAGHLHWFDVKGQLHGTISAKAHKERKDQYGKNQVRDNVVTRLQHVSNHSTYLKTVGKVAAEQASVKTWTFVERANYEFEQAGSSESENTSEFVSRKEFEAMREDLEDQVKAAKEEATTANEMVAGVQAKLKVARQDITKLQIKNNVLEVTLQEQNALMYLLAAESPNPALRARAEQMRQSAAENTKHAETQGQFPEEKPTVHDDVDSERDERSTSAPWQSTTFSTHVPSRNSIPGGPVYQSPLSPPTTTTTQTPLNNSPAKQEMSEDIASVEEKTRSTTDLGF